MCLYVSVWTWVELSKWTFFFISGGLDECEVLLLAFVWLFNKIII